MKKKNPKITITLKPETQEALTKLTDKLSVTNAEAIRLSLRLANVVLQENKKGYILYKEMPTKGFFGIGKRERIYLTID